ncbi:putative VQ motif-containing protein/14 [Helianthus annuus]|nr:putative VQ motif-containing protein/14 [Helianthus annuus]
MDNSDYSRNNHLGVNKIGKTIRKNPLPQSSFDNNNNNYSNSNPVRPVSQPQVYNINKNDFRNIVQQLTGSPSYHSQEPPVHVNVNVNAPKSPSTRLQRIRPPPLSPLNVNRPRMPAQLPLNHNNNNNTLGRYDQYGQQRAVVPPWSHAAESPTSAYMRYLQHSINDPRHPQAQSAGLIPNPHVPPLLPSPGSQFLLPSPSSYLNLSSPRSPYPLLSPGYQLPPPLSPNFPFSPGILGPGQQPPLSPGISFPLSPGFFPGLSPRWRD